jgi:hypothetical protein
LHIFRTLGDRRADELDIVSRFGSADLAAEVSTRAFCSISMEHASQQKVSGRVPIEFFRWIGNDGKRKTLNESQQVTLRDCRL